MPTSDSSMIAARRDVASARDELRVLSLGAEWLPVRAGGLNRYTGGLSQALQHFEVAQQWLVMGNGGRPPRSRVGVTFAARYDQPMWDRWRGLRTAFAEARDWSPDLVASHFAPYSFPLCRQLRALPHVVHFHGPWAAESAAEGAGWFRRRLKSLIERSSYRTADRFICLSHAFARVLVERYRVDPDLVHVIPGGVDTTRFTIEATRREAREMLGWDQNRPLALAVRRLVHRTGIAELILAFDHVRKSQPEALLTIAGTGPLEPELRELVNTAGLADHVRLLGFLADDLLPLAYRAADLSVMPSQSLEGFGLSAAESLAAGTPVVVTPIGGLPEVVSPLCRDLITADQSVTSIAARMSQILGGELAVPSQEACCAFARERFDWRPVASQVLEVYREARQARL